VPRTFFQKGSWQGVGQRPTNSPLRVRDNALQSFHHAAKTNHKKFKRLTKNY